MSNIPETPDGQVKLGRPVRVLLGILMLAGALLFLLLGAVLLISDIPEIPSPFMAIALGLVFIVLGLGFGFVGVRLIAMKAATDHLISANAAVIGGPVICALGLAITLAAFYFGPLDAISGGIFFMGIGYWLYRSGKRRQ